MIDPSVPQISTPFVRPGSWLAVVQWLVTTACAPLAIRNSSVAVSATGESSTSVSTSAATDSTGPHRKRSRSMQWMPRSISGPPPLISGL